jgi:hypothetical protein
VQREYNVLALIKGNEQYIFLHREEDRPALIAAIRDQAADPRLSMTWADAAILTEKVREQARTTVTESAAPAHPVRF